MSALEEARQRLRDAWDNAIDPNETEIAARLYHAEVMRGFEQLPSTFHRHSAACWVDEPVERTMTGYGKVPTVTCAELGAVYVASEVLEHPADG